MASFALSSKSMYLTSGNPQIRRQELVKWSSMVWRKWQELQSYTNGFTSWFYSSLSKVPFFFFYWFSHFCAGRISYLLLGPQHLQLSLPACSIGPTKLCWMSARSIHEFRQDKNTWFDRAAVRVGNDVSEVTHLVPAQCRHHISAGLIILQ